MDSHFKTVAIIVGLFFVIAFLDFKFLTTYEYLSKCCKANYRQINTTNKYNKEEVKIYCINCKKWCELIKK